MSRSSAWALLVAITALSACSPSQPAEAPATPSGSADPSSAPTPTMEPAPRPPPADTAAPGSVVKGAGTDDRSQSLASYELTPSDCDALGRRYGAVARSDQMAALSPKLSQKQRDATSAQVDKVVGKLEESWIQSCQQNLVNKAVDHAAITCALSAKTVKAFDVCLNGEAGTPQPAGKPGGKKK